MILLHTQYNDMNGAGSKDAQTCALIEFNNFVFLNFIIS